MELSTQEILILSTHRLGNNTEAKDKIKLFTELDTCDSCSRVIAEFAKNIELEVIHNNGIKVIAYRRKINGRLGI